jgi:hypothetical protein
VGTKSDVERARALACQQLPTLLSHFEFEVGGLPSMDQDDAVLARVLTNCQRALSRIATESTEDGAVVRSERARLLAAACNALTLHQHLNSIKSPIAAQVLDGVERSFEKAVGFPHDRRRQAELPT